MYPKWCHWLLLLLTFHLPSTLCVSHGGSSAPLNFRPANLYHVLRYARIREVNNNPRSLPPNVIEETRFITKEENGRTAPSFTIISWLKSLAEPLAYHRNAEAIESLHRRSDTAEETRGAELPSQSRKFGSSPLSSTPIPKGYFTVSKGVVKFIPMPSTTPRAVTYFVKNNNLVPAYGASASKDSKGGLTAAARLSDVQPTIVKDPKHRDGFFTVKSGQVRFHPLTANRNVAVSSGTGRRADSVKDFGNNFMDELRRKPQKIASKMSSTLLRSPTRVMDAGATSTVAAGNEIPTVTASSTVNRLPSVRMDDDTLFVPSSPSLDGQILFNRMSISDYLRQQHRDGTSEKMNGHQQLGSNILLSQMEALYPGFSGSFTYVEHSVTISVKFYFQEIVKDKSQIVIQNVFLTPLIDQMETLNKVTPIRIQNNGRNRLPIVLTNDAALYVPTETSNNGTVMFERFNVEEVKDVDIEHHSTSLAQIESFYPGFSKLTEQRPPQIIIHTSVLTVRQSTPSSDSTRDALWVSQDLPMVRIDNETVFVPSAPSANGTLVYSRQKVNSSPNRFRKGSIVSVEQIQIYYPGFGEVARSQPQPDQIVISNDFIVSKQGSKAPLAGPSSNRPKVIGGSVPLATVPSTEVAEEQVKPPISIKNQHQFFTFKPKPHFNYWQSRTTTRTSTTSTTSTTTTPSTVIPSSTEKVLEQSEAASEGAEIDELVKQLLGLPSLYSSTPTPLGALQLEENVSTADTVETLNGNHGSSTEVPSSSPEPEVTTVESGSKRPLIVSAEVPGTTESVLETAATENKDAVLVTKTKPNVSMVPVISSTKNSSSNFASLVLAHTAALIAGKPSPFIASQQTDHLQVPLVPAVQPEAMDSIISQLSSPDGSQDQPEAMDSIIAQLSSPNGNQNQPEAMDSIIAQLSGPDGSQSQPEAMDSIIAQLTSPEEDQDQPETIGHDPPPTFLANQVYSLAQSLIDSEEGPNGDEDDEVSESAVEAPVTQALVTTIVNHINPNSDASLSTESDKLEPFTDSIFVSEPIFTLHKKRPSSAIRPAEVTTTPSDSINDVATSSFHLPEPFVSNDTEIALSDLQAFSSAAFEMLNAANTSTSNPTLFITIGEEDTNTINSSTSSDVHDFTLSLTLPPEAGMDHTKPPVEIYPQSGETAVNSSGIGLPELGVLNDSSMQQSEVLGIQPTTTTHPETQITDKTTNHIIAVDEMLISEKTMAINSSTVVNPQYTVDLEETTESTSKPTLTTSNENLHTEGVKDSDPVTANAMESTTSVALSTKGPVGSTPTLDVIAANEVPTSVTDSPTSTVVKDDSLYTNPTEASRPSMSEILTTGATTAASTKPESPLITKQSEAANKTQSSRPPHYFTCGGESADEKPVFVSPKYPEPDVDQGRCTFRLKIATKNVCQVRVQFNDSRMLLPREGDCIDQFLSVSGSIVIPGVERFCGKNTDQHFYLDLTEPELGDPKPRSVEFHVITKARGYPYRYTVNIQQIDCSSAANEIRAPRGCFQYFPHPNGVVKSFNYEAGQYYNNVNYRICLRTADETCALALAAPDGQFGLHKANSRKVPRNRSGVGSRTCVRDYLFIPAGSRNGKVEAINEERYCGAKLSPLHGDKRPRVIIVPKYSGVYSMEFRTGTPRKFLVNNRGPGFRVSFAHIRHCAQTNQSTVSHLRLDDLGHTEDSFAGAFERIATTLFDRADESDVDREFSEDFYDSDEEPIVPASAADDQHNELPSLSALHRT